VDGFATCNRSLLTKAQASQIAELQYDENLRGCLTGYSECDHSMLSVTDAKEVATLGERRSLLACETGLGICDKSLLTPSEIDKVAGIENERNQLNCETGANAFGPGDIPEIRRYKRNRTVRHAQMLAKPTRTRADLTYGSLLRQR
jgi:hypothetical protein